ncbi:MAG: glutamate--tRNA ligase [Patescibacteria group bacterium]|nr:glutamate--tRNA ligase [Patescibacteria group bacterium]MDE1965939.1 glutamate--tRNA ligase [Patescibacteria group bacterium]
MSSVVTRFAPSPTGFMHVGGVRTALYAWLFAKKRGGTFILRIEDTDKEREVAGSIPHIIESLRWLGIEWDEGVDAGGPHAPYLQSERLDLYRSYAKRLIEAGYAYADPYTEEELGALREAAEAARRPFLFREHRPETTLPWDGTKPLRFRVKDVRRTVWRDLVRGELSAGEEALDDFILMKSDGYPTYNFAHVVDDIEMGVTHVMRGEEFISSTPKFLSLYEALGKAPPAYATMPVILGPDGKKKLSKRDGAKDLLEYRSEGYLPEALVNYLALLGWNPGTEQEFFTRDELIAAFDLARVQVAGARFDDAKLLSMNHYWMRQLSDERYLELLAAPAYDARTLAKITHLLKERARTFTEARAMLGGELGCFFTAPEPTAGTLRAKEPQDRPLPAETALKSLLAAVRSLPQDLSPEAVKEALMPLADAEEAKGKGGRGAMLWPLRYALSGQERSPDPFTLIALLGADESVSRIEKAISLLAD